MHDLGILTKTKIIIGVTRADNCERSHKVITSRLAVKILSAVETRRRGPVVAVSNRGCGVRASPSKRVLLDNIGNSSPLTCMHEPLLEF